MTEITATYFDGRTSKALTVAVRWHAVDERLEIIGADTVKRYAKKEFVVESRLGRSPRFIRFQDGSRCEIAPDDAGDALVDAWASNRAGAWLHRLESNWLKVIAAVAVLAAVGWAAINYGLPWAARHVAFALPSNTTRLLGDQTLAALDHTLLEPSKLSEERRRELNSKFASFLVAGDEPKPHAIEFRAMRNGGANAFALPSGVIVLTDALIELAQDDREIIAVLAHESGHLEQRHAVRTVLQNSVALVALALITGDVSSATAFGGALPAFLLQNRFSREFERETDAHAVAVLRRAGIDPAFLATMLDRLTKSTGEPDPKLLHYLSTHPSTPERIEAITGNKP